MKFDEINQNEKGEKLDEIIPAAAVLPALAGGAARAAAPVLRKGGQELMKRGAPVVKDLIKKGRNLFKRDPDGPSSGGRNKPRLGPKQTPPNVTTTAPKQPGQPPALATPKPPASATAPKPNTQPPPRIQQPKPGTSIPKPQQAPKPQARTNPKQLPKPKQAPGGVKSRTGTGVLPKKPGGVGGIGTGIGLGALGLAGLAALGGRGGAGGNPYGKEPDEFNTDNLPQGATGTQMATPAKGIVPGPGPKQAQAAADQPGADPTDPKAQAQQRKMQKMQKDVAQKQIKAKKAELDMLKKQLQSMK